MLIPRAILAQLQADVAARQSVLLLGPRQTGKTTLIQELVAGADVLAINLLRARDRDRYSMDPDTLIDEVKPRLQARRERPLLLVIDELQRVPRLADAVQLLLDEHKGEVIAILSGSSARKLRRGEVNLLPGRVVTRQLFPLDASESKLGSYSIDAACIYGRLPGIVVAPTDAARRDLLESYVETYLQEEIREEALVRSYGAFRAFLALAAERSGEEVRYEALATEHHVSAGTVKNFYGILLDTLVAFELCPINTVVTLPGRSPRRESKTSKLYLFDPGIVSALRGRWRPTPAERGKLLEHLVLADLLAGRARQTSAPTQIGFWRQHQGAEVDLVVSTPAGLCGIEVKATRQPGARDLRGLVHLHRAHGLARAIVACEVDRPTDLTRTFTSLDDRGNPPAEVLAVPIGESIWQWLPPPSD